MCENKTQQDKTRGIMGRWQGKARQGKTRQGKARQDNKTQQNRAQHDTRQFIFEICHDFILFCQFTKLLSYQKSCRAIISKVVLSYLFRREGHIAHRLCLLQLPGEGIKLAVSSGYFPPARKSKRGLQKKGRGRRRGRESGEVHIGLQGGGGGGVRVRVRVRVSVRVVRVRVRVRVVRVRLMVRVMRPFA
jgi:hypothetical protein